MSVGVWTACVGAPRPADCTDAASCGATDDQAASVPVPVPVAEAADPTPIRNAQDDGNVEFVAVDGDVPSDWVWVPWLGWGRTIDLLDLLATGGLGEATDPVTSNPGSFTTLERLCLEQGYPPPYCRARYGAP